MSIPYLEFVKAKALEAPKLGVAIAAGTINPILHRHQPVLTRWLVEGGRRALFASFGLGKTFIQLEAMRLVREAVDRENCERWTVCPDCQGDSPNWPGSRTGCQACDNAGGRSDQFDDASAPPAPVCLIIIPLTVVTEFKRDAVKLGVAVRFIRTTAEILSGQSEGFTGVYLTNYESVREGKIDMSIVTAVSLDEASCLRGFGGTKTFREFMAKLAGDDRKAGTRTDGIRFRFVATATPSPNEYIELLAYAAFLGIMDVGQAKTRFFKRNSEKADELTLHPHKEDEFWLWVNSWAAFIQRPSDLGFSDEGYDLPPLDVRWHEVASDHSKAGTEKDGQARLIKADAIGVVDASREKRETIARRVERLMELRAEDPDAHRLIWHDLEDERRAIEAAIPTVASVWGTGAKPYPDREQAIIAFSDGEVQELATKPMLAGSGCNFQRHCAWAIFLGIGFKFNDFIQAIHRVQRFQQTRQVRIDLIYSEAERTVRSALEGKWKRHEEMCARMSEIIRTYGLGLGGARQMLERSTEDGSQAVEESGDKWKVWRNDTVIQTSRLPENSVGLIVTSVPFSTQYEYTPSYNDFGHSDDNAHFFRQMDYLSPQLHRVLKPGRKLYVHVKDRSRPGGLEGVGFQTVDPFHAECIAHYRRHGFYYMGMITVETDVVRENNQTYRLGWSEKCKDGSRMSVGMPEYVLIFRKAPSDNSDGYADDPVLHDKAAYSRSRWQTDAHGKWRSSGDRLLSAEDLKGLDARDVYRLWREWSTSNVYDYEQHVALTKALEDARALPAGFALMPPHAWHPEVWSDVARMRTLNGEQAQQGREMHLCPLQFDIVDRIIEFDSNPGDVVYDPFGGLMTVPLRAIRKGRQGWAAELNPGYFADGVRILRAAEREMAVPSLFDLLDDEKDAA